MSTDRVADFRLVAAALVAVLLFSPGRGDAAPVDRDGPVPRGVFARSIAPTGDRAVVEIGRKPSLIEHLLAHPRVASPAWALLLASFVLALVGRRSRVSHQPSRPFYALLRRADPRRAPPFFPIG